MALKKLTNFNRRRFANLDFQSLLMPLFKRQHIHRHGLQSISEEILIFDIALMLSVSLVIIRHSNILSRQLELIQMITFRRVTSLEISHGLDRIMKQIGRASCRERGDT